MAPYNLLGEVTAPRFRSRPNLHSHAWHQMYISLTSSSCWDMDVPLIKEFAYWTAKALEFYDVAFEPAEGTGIGATIRFLKNYHPEVLTEELIDVLGAVLPNICGGYPQKTMFESSVNLFYISAYSILMVASVFIFCMDYKFGHLFWPLLLVLSYCLFQVAGYSCRYSWGNNLSDVGYGTSSIVFCQFAEYLLIHCNLVFADRICQWRFPHCKMSFNIFTVFYVVGFASFVCSVIAQVLPFYAYLSLQELRSCEALLIAGAVIEVVFAIIPFPLVYVVAILGWKSRILGKEKKSDGLYQPDWIEDTFLLSYPIPIHRPVNEKTHPCVTRVIPTLEPPGDGNLKIISKPMLPGSPRILTAQLIVFVSAIIMCTSPIVRIAACELIHSQKSQVIVSLDPLVMNNDYFPQSPAAIWIFFGGVQLFVVCSWLLLRVDLRFYIPPLYKRETNRPHFQKLYETLG